MIQLLYQYQSLSITHDTGKKLLCLNWEDDVEDQIYASMLKKLYQFTRELEVEHWIIDASGAHNLQSWEMPADIFLFSSKTTPDLLINVLKRTKLKKIARVISVDIAYEARINSFVTRHQLPVRCGFFTTEASAVEWLYQEEKQTA